MKNYLKILLIISFMFFGCTNLKKSLDTKYQINEIIIYLDFQEKGYTTASAYTHFDNLIHDRIDTVILSSIELNNIELVLSNALQKKHNQTKLGINLIFCKVKYFDNEKEYFVFTDSKSLSCKNDSRVHIIPQKDEGWPFNTLLRFHFFDKISQSLESFDFTFFFNANMIFNDFVNDSFLPQKNQLLVLHFQFRKHPNLPQLRLL